MYELKEEKSLKLYSTSQAADILGIEHRVMNNLLEAGKIGYLMLGDYVLIPRQFIYEYIKEELKAVQDRFDEREKYWEYFIKCRAEEENQSQEFYVPAEEENTEANSIIIDGETYYYPEEENSQNLDQTEVMDNAERI